MARFERSKAGTGKRESRDSGSSRDGRPSRSFEDSPRNRGGRSSDRSSRGRSSSRDFSRGGKSREDIQKTRVTCSSCGASCEVPFKPTSDKPLFCDACFAKKGKSSSDRTFDRARSSKTASNGISSSDLDIINEKLNKIMKALDIE